MQIHCKTFNNGHETFLVALMASREKKRARARPKKFWWRVLVFTFASISLRLISDSFLLTDRMTCPEPLRHLAASQLATKRLLDPEKLGHLTQTHTNIQLYACRFAAWTAWQISCLANFLEEVVIVTPVRPHRNSCIRAAVGHNWV